MSRLSNNIAKLLVKGRYGWAFLALVLTIFFAYFSLKITFNLSPENIYIEDDPAYQFYETTYLKQFGHLGTPCVLALKGSGTSFAIENSLNQVVSKLKKNP